MTIQIFISDDSGDPVFYEAITGVQRIHLRGEASGYPSLPEAARVIARYGYPMEIFRDAQERLKELSEAELRKSGCESANAQVKAARQ